MRAKKCDRCGTLYEQYDGSKRFKESEKANAISLIDRDLDNKYWERKSYDLCPGCMKQFERFLHGDVSPHTSELKVTFPPETEYVTVELGDDVFRAYLGEYSKLYVPTPQGVTTKRKFNIIEV